MPSQDFSSQPKIKESKVLPAITNNILAKSPEAQPLPQSNNPELSIYEAQDILYKFFIYHINHSKPELAWQEFKKIFIEIIAPVDSKLIRAIHTIIFSNNQTEFNNLFKRCCYILLNNWISHREYQLSLKLVKSISEITFIEPVSDNSLNMLRVWLIDFVNTQDYEDIKSFVAKYDHPAQTHWTSRYEPYLLAARYLDTKNTPEERETAKLLAQQLKDKYKFELAMYTSRSQSATIKFKPYYNPTLLGDEALRLIKIILINRGSLSYSTLANLFIGQSRYITCKQFKEGLIKYLFYYNEEQKYIDIIQEKLIKILDLIHPENDAEIFNSSVLLRICNHLIKCLTVENSGEPTALFRLFATQLNPLTLAMIMLKIILISPHSRIHLEACFARLIQYYQDNSAEECQWLINFLEVCQIALTIYGENVQYNLVNMSNNSQAEHLFIDLNNCRVFSQQKKNKKDQD
jgi:hypothetical protein